ncbi:hypothetical protein AALB16_15135 [Lachnospiraceae bacterium 62-35]
MRITHFFADIDRDPRDIYIDLLNGKSLIGKELEKSRNPYIYVKWHNAFRTQCKTDSELEKNVFRIQFEDLVENYSNVVPIIEEFLGLNPNDHKRPKEFFDPDKSKRNVGLWKKYAGKKEIEVITNEILNKYN